jgi:hypothetical protein
MSLENTDSDLLFKIHRIKDKKGNWMPAIQDVTSHDISPVWVAGLAYMIIDRYINCIEESRQNKFYEETLYWLEKMLKDNEGSGYIEKIDKPKSMD